MEITHSNSLNHANKLDVSTQISSSRKSPELWIFNPAAHSILQTELERVRIQAPILSTISPVKQDPRFLSFKSEYFEFAYFDSISASIQFPAWGENDDLRLGHLLQKMLKSKSTLWWLGNKRSERANEIMLKQCGFKKNFSYLLKAGEESESRPAHLICLTRL